MYSEAERRKWLYGNRNKILSLDELLEVSESYHGGRERLSLFGLTAEALFAAGFRIAGRTAIECCIDADARDLAMEARAVRERFFPHEAPVLIDLFCGSCNLLYHLSRELEAERAIGFEMDDLVHELTKNNLGKMDQFCELYHGDYRDLIKGIQLAGQNPIVVFIAPPWGGGFTYEGGLDLLATEPPVDEIIADLNRQFSHRRLFFLIQTFKRTSPRSIDAIVSGFAYHAHTFSRQTDKENGILTCAQNQSASPNRSG
jgi:hypothetical protein